MMEFGNLINLSSSTSRPVGVLKALCFSTSMYSVVILLAFVQSLHAAKIDNNESFVGLPARLEQIVLPGTELKVRPLADRKQPVVLRIEQTYPHGGDFRYDMVYYSLEPGQFDLRDYLVRADGSPAADLPPLVVKVASSLPSGQIEPNALQHGLVPRMGGYRGMLWIAAGLWFLGLAAIILIGRKHKAAATRQTQQHLSLSQQLQNTAELVISGRFTESDKSKLERLLLAYWRKRLDLEDARPEEAMAAMRAHQEAAHLLDQLERWLHRPAGVERIDVVELLKPYLEERAEDIPQMAGGTTR